MRVLSLGMGLAALGVAAGPSSLTAQASGQAIFDQKCVACHSTGSDRLIGPGLEDVMTRRDRAWVKQMIMQPDRMLASGDSIATRLLQDLNDAVARVVEE